MNDDKQLVEDVNDIFDRAQEHVLGTYPPDERADERDRIDNLRKRVVRRIERRITATRAREILQCLGTEDLLFAHHGGVMARPDAYARLAELIAESL